MGRLFSFRMSGLSVWSEIDLAPAARGAAFDAPADVVIRFGAAPETLRNAEGVGPTWSLAGDDFLIAVPGVARFLLHAGKAILVDPEDGATVTDITAFLAGTVFGILLHQRGQIVLHASAVRVGERAVLFCGPSGAGKSTLAAAFGQLGYALLNDDVCAIGLDASGAPVAHSDGRQLKLWRESIQRLDIADRQGAAVRPHVEKFYVSPGRAAVDTLPIAAVYALRETLPPLVDSLEAANVVDAALLIRRNAYRPRLVTAMKQGDAYFRAAAAIVANAGVYILTRRMEFAAMPQVVRRVERHLQSVGLAGARP